MAGQRRRLDQRLDLLRRWPVAPGNPAQRRVLGTTYDDAARTVTRVFYTAGDSPLATNTVEFDRRGNAVQGTDAGGYTWTASYDGLDRVKVAAGPLVTNLVATGMDPEEYTTNLIQQSTTYTYSASDQVLAVQNALGETTVATNDALGRVIWSGTYASNSATPLRVTSTLYRPTTTAPP